jgi:hypothetical protein
MLSHSKQNAILLIGSQIEISAKIDYLNPIIAGLRLRLLYLSLILISIALSSLIASIVSSR